MPQQSTQHDRARWRPSEPNTIKVNFDGVLKALIKTRGIRVVIKNVAGELMGAKTAKVHNVTDPFVVEATVAIQAMEFTQDLGFQCIILKGDALSIISKLRNNNYDLSVIGHLIEEGHERAKLFHSCQSQHTFRTRNIVAHTLARLGLEKG
ncbi:hypothetical protein PTKIN_Ptkin05aG0123100 [Pterospermum kingtungense]